MCRVDCLGHCGGGDAFGWKLGFELGELGLKRSDLFVGELTL
jgi:hypothetical protein